MLVYNKITKKQIVEDIARELLDSNYLNLASEFFVGQLEDIQEIILIKLQDYIVIDGRLVE